VFSKKVARQVSGRKCRECQRNGENSIIVSFVAAKLTKSARTMGKDFGL
jgi:hypothetical protein